MGRPAHHPAAHSSSQPTVDDAGGQAASSPRGQQHVSTGHEDLQEGDADAPTHTPAEDPPQPNLPQRPRQDTPDTMPMTPSTQPPREAQPGHVTHGHRPDNEHRPFSRQTSTVLASNKYRSRDE